MLLFIDYTSSSSVLWSGYLQIVILKCHHQPLPYNLEKVRKKITQYACLYRFTSAMLMLSNNGGRKKSSTVLVMMVDRERERMRSFGGGWNSDIVLADQYINTYSKHCFFYLCSYVYFFIHRLMLCPFFPTSSQVWSGILTHSQTKNKCVRLDMQTYIQAVLTTHRWMCKKQKQFWTPTVNAYEIMQSK